MAKNCSRTRNAFHLVASVIAFVVVLAGAVKAQDPSIVVRGDIRDPKKEVALTIGDLEAMPNVDFTTTTMWTKGDITFSGPTVASVLAALGAGTGDVHLTAINDYDATLPRTLIDDTAPIIATRMNGKRFSIAENGPFWIVFPYDADSKYRTEAIYAASVWQLAAMEILK